MSYLFDGVDDIMESTAALSALVNTSFTMAVWCKPTDATPAANRVAFSLGKSSSSSTEYVYLQQTAGIARMGSVQSGADTTDTADGAASDGQWFLMVGRFTVNGSNDVTAHTINSYNQSTATAATKVDEALATAKSMSTFDKNRIGLSRSFAYFDGYIAHAAIWSALLTDGEVAELYTKVPSAVAPSSLYVYWPMLTDSTEAKQGGGTFDMTVTGATLNSGDGPTLSSGSSSVAALAHYYRAMRAD